MLQQISEAAKIPVLSTEAARDYVARVGVFYHLDLPSLTRLVQKPVFEKELTESENQAFQSCMQQLQEAVRFKAPPKEAPITETLDKADEGPGQPQENGLPSVDGKGEQRNEEHNGSEALRSGSPIQQGLQQVL